MNGIDEFLEQIKQADDPTEALIIDLYQTLKSADRPGAKKIISKIQGCLTTDGILTFINASDWLICKPPEPDQIIKDIIDIADKLAIIGPPQTQEIIFSTATLHKYCGRNDFLVLEYSISTASCLYSAGNKRSSFSPAIEKYLPGNENFT
jgi:hypothetical protein